MFGDNAHQRTHYQSYADSAQYTPFGEFKAAERHRFRKNIIYKSDTGQRRQYDGTPVAQVERPLYHSGADTGGVADTDKKSSHNRKEDTNARNKMGARP